jgi:hypothetical protein
MSKISIHCILSTYINYALPLLAAVLIPELQELVIFPFLALPALASIIIVLESVIKRDLGLLNHLDPKSGHNDCGCSRPVNAMDMHCNALSYDSFCIH